jgi:hypothetical protein
MNGVVVNRPRYQSAQTDPVLLVGTWFAQPVTHSMREDAHRFENDARSMDILNGARTTITMGDVRFGCIETFDEVCNLVDARRFS